MEILCYYLTNGSSISLFKCDALDAICNTLIIKQQQQKKLGQFDLWLTPQIFLKNALSA